jgi:hypothetical protein
MEHITLGIYLESRYINQTNQIVHDLMYYNLGVKNWDVTFPSPLE